MELWQECKNYLSIEFLPLGNKLETTDFQNCLVFLVSPLIVSRQPQGLWQLSTAVQGWARSKHLGNWWSSLSFESLGITHHYAFVLDCLCFDAGGFLPSLKAYSVPESHPWWSLYSLTYICFLLAWEAMVVVGGEGRVPLVSGHPPGLLWPKLLCPSVHSP